MPGLTMLPIAAVVAVVSAQMGVTGVPASLDEAISPSARSVASTVMYRGQRRIGEVASDGLIDCDAYDGAFVVTNRKGTWLNIEAATSGLLGFARRSAPGRWTVFAAPRRPIGRAQRRTATRWDVFRGSRGVGRTVGPHGPQAAAALLVACWL